MTRKSDQELLAEAQALDLAYASADAFDAKMHDQWVRTRFERFTKRTDYPKLGWIISCLNDLGIASIVHGRSFHGPLLWVEKDKLDEAWEVLRGDIDDIEDDDPQFAEYANVQPDTDLY